MKYFTNQGVLVVNGRAVELPFPCVQILSFQSMVIVRIEPSKGEIFNRNIFAVSNHGEIVWQIAESPHGTQTDKPYTSVYIGDGGELMAGNWNGVDYVVATEDGSIKTKSFRK